MGNTIEEKRLAGNLKSEKMLQCPNCLIPYDLEYRVPIMICSNQHNLCEKCLQDQRPKNCPQCKELLWIRKAKNIVLCHILTKILKGDNTHVPSIKQQPYQHSYQHPQKPLEREGQSPSHGMYQTIDSPSKKNIKVKTVKRQSTNDLNLELYKQKLQFRKKYSVANAFASSKEVQEQKNPTKEETLADELEKCVQEYKIVPFKEILQSKKEPESVLTLELHLYKIPNIFECISSFTSLVRLNLSKNRISTIENLNGLTQLTYLSLSDNQIAQICNLGTLTNLKNLYLNRNRIQEIQNLQNLTALEFLGLGYNEITKIERMQQLVEIKWLNLEANYIAKIEGISTMKKLEIILLGSNQITDFEGFNDFPELKQIHLENNKIQNVNKALSMKHLRRLKLQDNPGLKEDTSVEYVRMLEIMEAKSKGIQVNNDSSCQIY